MRRYGYKRRYEWSPEIAYSVGLMASDGCLSSDGRHLTLVSIDIDQLQNFCHALGRSLPITKHQSTNTDRAFRVQFSDTAYYDFLVKCGLTCRKSATIGAIDVPDVHFNHFLRGVFDGDGSTIGYFDPRWRSSFMYYVIYSSASIPFLDFLLKKICYLASATGGSIHHGKGADSLVYAKRDSLILYNFMYKNCSNLFLARKKHKLEGFIKQDEDVTILRLSADVVKLADTQP